MRLDLRGSLLPEHHRYKQLSSSSYLGVEALARSARIAGISDGMCYCRVWLGCGGFWTGKSTENIQNLAGPPHADHSVILI